MKPLIGVTAGEIMNLKKPWAPLTYGQSHTYTDAIVRAGGIPIIIPIFEDTAALRQLYDRLDGMLFAGGNDIDPMRYHEVAYKAKHATDLHTVSTRRDTLEVELMRWALADDLPLFAICRGAQLLNVISGGTLYQDIADQVEGASNHDLSYDKKDGTFIAHELLIKPKSRLRQIIGTENIDANTHHHQAIKDMAPDLVVTARAEDGIIEAIEKPNARFAIGIQCHPEEITEVEPKWQRVFDALVKSSQPD